MSTKTTNDATLQTTKQMLDELDALMEKMLSLPVNDAEDAQPFPQEVVKAPALTPTLTATLMLLEPPPKAPPIVAPPLTSEEPTASHPLFNPPHLEMPPAPVFEPAPPPEPLTNEVMPASVLHKLGPLLEDIPEPAAPVTTQWGYLPLLWINLAFDGSTMILGTGGAWLRSQAGRMVLGVSGIALLLVAAGWFLKDWLGWN